MALEVSLNGPWELRDEILTLDASHARRLSTLDEGWIEQPVPGDIHQGLIATGRIAEPVIGLNSYDCAWTEQRSWWFRRRFQTEPGWQDADIVELELNGLDSNAEIFLNGQHLGSHRNAFRPFVTDVKPWLARQGNVLLVRLSAGVEDVSEADMDAPDGIRAGTEGDRGRPERGDPRRTLARKPQYSFGWDWAPRVATTAIAGNVSIRHLKQACIRHVQLLPRRHGDGVLLAAIVTVDRLHYYKTAEGSVRVTLTDADGRRFSAEQTNALLRSGLNFVELTIPIDAPQLWWPNGMGEQHLYRVEAEVEAAGVQSSYPPFDYGIRFVALNTQDLFAVEINGEKVFCKGANWIPADVVYARTEDDRYDRLIREARDANFNMLRIWGGGWYERDAFYNACDRYGILVWHDFMFACAPYPDHLEWFRREVAEEADYQTKHLQHHACIALWSGSNENNWGFRDWWDDQTQGGAWIYNYLLPQTVHTNTPEIPYWNGSPYGGEAPNSSDVGDRHHWHDCMMNPDMEKRIVPEEYDKCSSLFVSEFGYIGACCKESILTYMDDAPIDRGSRAWQHHTNTFEKDTVLAGIRRHYLPSLAKPEALSLDDYVLYSGLCQGLMLSYALDSMRYRENCHGGLFWMYNDCWGEVGWTIIDYYLRRKPSWYFVRRSFAPQRLILRPHGEEIRVVLANDTRQSAAFDLEYGYTSLDGTVQDLARARVEASPLARTELCTFGRGDHNALDGLWFARAPGQPGIEPAIFRAVDYQQLRTTQPALALSIVERGPSWATVEVSAKHYAHAVHFDLPQDSLPSDNYFDLLPGETRTVRIVSTQSIAAGQIGVTCVNERVR
jgi:beta-mannosidase